MALTGTVQIEKEIQSSPKKFFHRFMDLPSHFHKAVGHDSHRSTLLEGDGKNVGSLLHFNYALDGTTVLGTVFKIEALDEEKYLVIFGGHEGDALKRYKVIKFIYQER
uniref:Bet v I/Major latex protein domain-containing protein n=1 Tax=Nelumbo nucifera TaxID=4432 RepID=A0A822Z3E1_NELNU|nr:TPA_asm: hypothetical protein HUJ06_013865 [Nelumbo nucifera]